MKKKKFSLLLNISTMCLALFAIVIGVFSLQQASVTISGSLGYVKHEKVTESYLASNWKNLIFTDLNKKRDGFCWSGGVSQLVFTKTKPTDCLDETISVGTNALDEDMTSITAEGVGDVIAYCKSDSANTGKYIIYLYSPVAISVGNKSYLYSSGSLFSCPGAQFANLGMSNIDFTNADFTNVTDMQGMFRNCANLTSLDLSNIDTSQVTDMSSMFSFCSKLSSLDLSGLDTSNVTNMSEMFSRCTELTNLNISNIDTSQVTDMSSMFSSCSSLSSLDLSSFDTSNVTNMEEMFSKCNNLLSLNLANLDTSQVTNMNAMFNSCNKLESLDVSSFDTSNVTKMDLMFSYCSQLLRLDLYSFNTGKVANMTYMFYNCTNLQTIIVDSSIWEISQVKSSFNMFTGCTSLVGISGTVFDSSNPTDKTYAIVDEGELNPGYLSVIASYLAPNWKNLIFTDSYVGNSNGFCSTSDISQLIFTNTEPEDCFEKTINVGTNASDEKRTTSSSLYGAIDVMAYYKNDTSNSGKYIIYLYSPYTIYVGNTSYNDTEGSGLSNIVTQGYQFSSLYYVTKIDFTNADFSKVTNMSYMFAFNSSLMYLDLTKFNTSNVTDTTSMFYGCSSLSVIYVDSNTWQISQVTSSSEMFYYCTSLVGGAGTKYSSSHTDKTYARVDEGTSKPGYFTEK